ncbi:MAG: NUDIX domain-containing protein [Candidatus Buchananbacteria bacterium]|nr:NUDIX domain-containing protein [Candidatus Buchananbacteria bacterium]
MIREKSVGIIVYRIHPEEGIQYLVLYHRGNYWNFPKGRVEDAESELQTGLRELSEEAAITDIEVVDGWRQQTHFFFRETRDGKSQLVKKDFVLYLAYAPRELDVRVSDEHLNGYAWLDYKTAMKYMRFKNLKAIVTEAHSFVTERHPS